MSDPSEDPRIAARIADPSRLAAVRSTLLLDAPAREQYDRLTRLAAKLLEVPVAFLSLVDADRDFYVSNHGFDGTLREAREMRGRTFCHLALLEEGVLRIDDTLATPRFAAVPTVQTMGIRAYIGAPLVSSDGARLGTFCAVDFKARQWTEEQAQSLVDLSAIAEREFTLGMSASAAATLAESAVRAMRGDMRAPLDHPAIALRREPLAASILLTAASLLMQAPARQAWAAIEISSKDPGKRVLADGGRMLQAFAEIIGGAIEAGGPGTLVRLGATPVESGVRFIIADDAPPAARNLELARSIVEAHGGALEAVPAEGGTRIAFMLPAA